MKKTIFVLLIALILPISAQAYAVKTENSIYINKDEVIEGNLYAVGSTINIEGKITGDVICAGQTININGEITGDVICAGQNINLNGNVGGSFRALADSINVTAKISRNFMAAAASIVTGSNSEIGWDALLGGSIINLRGKIGRNFSGGASQINLSAEIGGDANIRINDQSRTKNTQTMAKSLTVGNTAKIKGNLTYTSNQDAQIDNNAQIAGKSTRKTPMRQNKGSRSIFFTWFWSKIFSIFSALVIGLVLISLWREKIKKISENMLDNITRSLSIGIIIFFLVPIVAIFLLFTLIGIPLALIATTVWAIGIYIAKIITAILIGRSLLFKDKDESLVWSMIIGIIACWIVFSLPIIGWLLGLAAIWWGLGGLWLALKKT